MNVCAHYTDAERRLAPPAGQDVYKDECLLCFDSADVPSGVSVCATCFQAGCLGDRSHAGLHYHKSEHPIVVTLTRTPKPRAPLTKLQVVERAEEEEYTYSWTPRCVACDPTHGRELPKTDALTAVAEGILRATSSAHKAEVQAWEEEVVPCTHTKHLAQTDATPLELANAACAECGLTSNLWLCLSCGHLGCGRAQFGGVAGNSHGLAHFEASGHPCSVKQGTITAEGTGDVYCYACNDARVDPALGEHLAHFGMNVAEQSKTEKSMTELQLEQNARFDFSMTTDDGRALEPLFGPGYTGLRNLGNSCYMASVLQALFALPAFQARYNSTEHAQHIAECSAMPAACLACQLGKLADGLLSGRYAVPRPGAEGDVAFQAGIKPAMLKALLGRGHAEFGTMRQQDADEFLQHFVQKVHEEPHPDVDPTHALSYALEHRLQCTQCKRVRYSEELREVGVALPVAVRERASDDRHADAASGKLYEPVTLEESLAALTAPETLPYHCPACHTEVSAEKTTKFKTFPEVLVVQAQRFQLVNWVPQKVNVPFQVPLEGELDIAAFQGHGMQSSEEALPDDAAPDTVDLEALSMLTAMGFSENRARRALDAAGNAEAAANWLFERMEDASLDAPLGESKPDTSMLEEMGFSAAQAAKALRLTGNPEAAVAWLFEHPDDAGDVDAPSAPPVTPGLVDAPRYRLASFITHRGPSVHSGHYVAHVHHGTEPKEGWAFFNDEKVVRAPFAREPEASNDSSVEHLSELYVVLLTQRLSLRLPPRLDQHLADLLNAARQRRERHRAPMELVHVVVRARIAECVARRQHTGVLDRRHATEGARVVQQRRRRVLVGKERGIRHTARQNAGVFPRRRPLDHRPVVARLQRRGRLDLRAGARVVVVAAAPAGVVRRVPPLEELEEKDAGRQRILEHLKHKRSAAARKQRAKEHRELGQGGEGAVARRDKRLLVALHTPDVDTHPAVPRPPVRHAVEEVADVVRQHPELVRNLCVGVSFAERVLPAATQTRVRVRAAECGLVGLVAEQVVGADAAAKVLPVLRELGL